MSLVSQRKPLLQSFFPDRIDYAELGRVCSAKAYMLLMGVFLLEFLCRMAFFSNNAYTPRFAAAGHIITAILGIWLGKTWKDKGFRLMACYLLWMALRCFISVREEPERSLALDRILTVFWAVGGCYSFGRIFSAKETKRFLALVCFVWTTGMMISSCLGIAAAWMRIKIPNLSGYTGWKIWGEASSARLNLIYCSTISGGILSASVMIALLAGLQAKKTLVKSFFFLAVLPMILALCLTDSRTAQITLSVGCAALFFVYMYTRLRSRKPAGYMPASGPATAGGFRMLALYGGTVLVCAAVFLALLKINPLFDSIKIASTRLGILPSAAVTDESTVMMSHRGLNVEDVLTGRDQIWKAAVAFLKDHPRYLLYGTSIVNPVARVVDQSVLNFTTDHCHNIALQILVESGLPGFLMFLGFVCYISRKSFRLILRGTAPLWLMMIPCLLLSIFIGDMGECLTWLGFRSSPVPFLLFLLAGLAASSETAGRPEKRRPGIRSYLVFPAVCVILICSVAPFVFHYSVPVIRQDNYDDPVHDLYYECGDQDCETHHGSHTIKTSGCGLCAISNAVRYMTGRGIDVRSLAEFARDHEQYIIHTGSKSTISEETAKAFGDDYGFCYIGAVSGLPEATNYIRQGCTAVAGVGNSLGGGHLLVVADYDPLTKEYLILDSAGNYDGWSHSFCSWQRIRDNHLQTNSDVYFTSFRILAPTRLQELSKACTASDENAKAPAFVLSKHKTGPGASLSQ